MKTLSARVSKLDIAFVCLLGPVVLFYCVPPLRSYQKFWLQNFDYGIALNSLSLLSRFTEPNLTTRGLNAWADNQDYLQFFLSWLLYLPQAHYWILIVYSLGIVASGVVSYCCLRASPWLALGIPLFLWLSPLMININIDVLHTESFATVFLLGCYFAAKRGNRLVYFVTLVLALICKEDVAVTAGAFSALAAWRYRTFKLSRRDFVIGLALCVSLLAVNQLVVLPHYKSVTCLWLSNETLTNAYGHTSPWFSNLSEKLGSWSGIRGQFFSSAALGYLAMLLWPALLVPECAFPWLLVALPGALINLIGGAYLIHGTYHYDHSTMAAVAITLCEALPRARHMVPRVAALVSVLLLMHLVPFESHKLRQRLPELASREFWDLEKSPRVTALEKLDKILPRDAVISADYTSINYLLESREKVYMFENPFRPAYFGVYGACDGNKTPLRNLPDVDLVLVSPDREIDPSVRQLLSEKFDPHEIGAAPKSILFDAFIRKETEYKLRIEDSLHSVEPVLR